MTVRVCLCVGVWKGRAGVWPCIPFVTILQPCVCCWQEKGFLLRVAFAGEPGPAGLERENPLRSAIQGDQEGTRGSQARTNGQQQQPIIQAVT